MAEKIEELFQPEQLEKLDILIKGFENKPGSLIPLLEKSQDLLGYLPVCVQRYISTKTNTPPNTVYGVVSFYSFFTMKAKARHRLQICGGTACYVKGGKEIAEKIENEYHIKVGETTADDRFTYEKARCFGACGLAPVVVIDGKVYGKVTVDSIDEILEQYQ
jgi:NADH:ubiquinone oxidoreductase subunit E